MWFRRSVQIVLSAGCCFLPAACGVTSNNVPSDVYGDGVTAHKVQSIDGFDGVAVTSGKSAFRNVNVELETPVNMALNDAGLVLNPGHVVMDAVDVGSPRRAPGDGLRQGDAEVRVVFRVAGYGQDACASEAVVGPFGLNEHGQNDSAHYLRAMPDPSQWAGDPRGFSVCAEVQSDFDGVLELGPATLFAKKKADEPDDESQDDSAEGDEEGEFPVVGVLVCHVPPGHPERSETIAVAQQAVNAHLAHGDYLGACTDDDGGDDDEEQPQPVELTADAGPDVSVIAGESVVRAGLASVLTGTLEPGTLVYSWSQTAGPAAPYNADGYMLSVDTTGVEGPLVFQLTVATSDGSSSASDDFVVNVLPLRVEQVVTGRYHHSVRRNNHSASFWGWNRYGQMGDGSDLPNVVSMDAAVTHTLFATSDGMVWTVGINRWATTSVPVQVTGIDNVVQVSTLSVGGIMLRNDGTVWGFADDRNLQCALAGEPYAGVGGVLGPIPIPGVPANITAVSSGNQHTIALDVDGNAWVWGSRFGCTPWVALDNVVAVAAGETDLCLFVRGDGTAWAMGFNLHGQLGNGTTVTNYASPTQVVGLTNVVSVAAGDRHSMFLRSDGTLWTAGWNNDCRLGLEAEISPAVPQYGATVLTPAQVPLANVVAIAGGYAHGVAVTADDSTWVWGLNSSGQLDDGTNESLAYVVCTPVPVTLAGP